MMTKSAMTALLAVLGGCGIEEHVAGATESELESSCPAGQLDMLDWMTLDADLRGSTRLFADPQPGQAWGLPLYTVVDPGRIWHLKTPYGDTWDLIRYDSEYVYFEATEQAFHSPWACKPAVDVDAWRAARRCVDPADASAWIGEQVSRFTITSSGEVQHASGDHMTMFEVRDVGSMDWGPQIGNVPTIVLDYGWQCAGGVCKNLEQYFLTQRHGMVQWLLHERPDLGGVQRGFAIEQGANSCPAGDPACAPCVTDAGGGYAPEACGAPSRTSRYDVVQDATTPHHQTRPDFQPVPEPMYSCDTPPTYGQISSASSPLARNPSIDDTGKLIAYEAAMQRPDGSYAVDVMVFDATLQASTRASVAPGGGDPAGHSQSPSISRGNGRYIAFVSDAANLVSGDTNGVADIFVFDRVTGTTSLASIGLGGPANGGSASPSISGDGCRIAFESTATNLIPGVPTTITTECGQFTHPPDTNGTTDVFIRDRCAGTTTRASVSLARQQAVLGGARPSIDDSGRFVSYTTRAPELGASEISQIVVYDRCWGVTNELVSKSSAGDVGNFHSDHARISGNGQYVVFESSSNNLVETEHHGAPDAYVHDRWALTTTSPSLAHRTTTFGGLRPSISSDGRFVAFLSPASPVPGSYAPYLYDSWAGDVIAPRLGGAIPTQSWIGSVALSTHLVAIADRVMTDRITFAFEATIGPEPRISDLFTRTVTVPTRRPLEAGNVLAAGESRLSGDGQYRFQMGADGNLVLSRTADGVALWSSGTQVAFSRVTMQGDGNLVIRAPNNTVTWSSGTYGNPGARMFVQNDGNVVIYNTSNVALWATSWANQLRPGAVLTAGQSRYSTDGRFQLVMQTDGNLVFYRVADHVALWSSQTWGHAGSRAVMQNDGNLVVRGPDSAALWYSSTWGNAGATLHVQDAGNIVIYATNGTALWSRPTGP